MRNLKLERKIRRVWKPRPRRSHKTDYGRIFILAGSKGLTGAAALAGFAAVRAGAGLVTVGCPEAVYPIVARRFPEVMVRPFPSSPEGSLSETGFTEISAFLRNQDVFALGPGLGRHPATQKLIRRLIAHSPLPLVIDADAVNALTGHADVLKKCRHVPVLTPHPGEFVRAFGGPKPESDAARKKRVAEIARKCRCVLVLKGYRTVAADPSGRTHINSTGNSGMATGGSGDVLTGIIAALEGQGLRPWDAARFGVYLHGLAGDLAAKKIGEISLAAGDLIEFLPRAVRLVTG